MESLRIGYGKNRTQISQDKRIAADIREISQTTELMNPILFFGNNRNPRVRGTEGAE